MHSKKKSLLISTTLIFILTIILSTINVSAISNTTSFSVTALKNRLSAQQDVINYTKQLDKYGGIEYQNGYKLTPAQIAKRNNLLGLRNDALRKLLNPEYVYKSKSNLETALPLIN